LHSTDAPNPPQGTDFTDMVAAHYEDMLDFYGVELGLRVSRKHLGWYMDVAGTVAAHRREILTAKSPAQVLERLPAALEQGEAA